MKYLLYLFALLLLLSCRKNLDNSTGTLVEATGSEVNDEFKLYLDNFEKINLPVTINGCNINPEDYKRFDGKQFTKYAEEFSLAYGRLPTNGNYIATLTLGAADCYLPILTTYKLNGQLIDQKTIAGGCGSGCGFDCKELTVLKENFSFYTSDTISSYTCDSLAEEVPGSYEYYSIYRKGRLLKNGKIEFSQEIRKDLPGRKSEP